MSSTLNTSFNMPKVKQYEHKFRKGWLQDGIIKDWVMSIHGDVTKARCKYCKCKMKAKIQDLKKHAETKKHKNAVPFRDMPPLTFVFRTTQSNESSKVEGSVAMFVVICTREL